MSQNSRKCCIISTETDITEIRELCRTLGIDVVCEIIQKRRKPDPTTFVGKGKLKDLEEEREKIDLFIFNGNLTPSQHFRLETTLKKPCIDRIEIVLEIFAKNASSSEAKAQIALARIKYELPFLREWVSKSVYDDRPGFLAGGEYAVDAYYENARKQMKKIEKELNKISSERARRRDRRKDRGFFLTAICGYTNSGKSSLLVAFSGADVLIDDKMFSTLSTTTRKINNAQRKILLTDTVGFISNLPTDLIEAFDATMEEIYGADCVILVIDCSDEKELLRNKFAASLKLLNRRVDFSRIIVALNKIDRMSSDELRNCQEFLRKEFSEFEFYPISALRNTGIEQLKESILEKIGAIKEIEISLRNDSTGKEQYYWLSTRFIVMDSIWNEEIHLRLSVTEEELEVIRTRAMGQGDIIVRPVTSAST